MTANLQAGAVLYRIDGTPCTSKIAGTNAMGYPYIVEPIKPGARPTRQRLYTAEHLAKRGIQIIRAHSKEDAHPNAKKAAHL